MTFKNCEPFIASYCDNFSVFTGVTLVALSSYSTHLPAIFFFQFSFRRSWQDDLPIHRSIGDIRLFSGINWLADDDREK
jgi:hypothetical protein